MKQKDILLLLVPSFIMVLAWVIFNIYHSSVSSTITDSLSIQIIPISPSFNQKEIDAIKNREQISPVYEFVQTPVPVQSPKPVPSPTESPSPSPTSSISALPTQSLTPQATQGGETIK